MHQNLQYQSALTTLPPRFQFETRWIVFTSGPSSGKTTLIERIQKKGFKTVQEAAGIVINEWRKKKMDPSQDEARLQQEILQRKLTFETKQDRRSLVFLDRGIPDSLSYYRRAGLDPSTALTHCFTNKYRYVFLFERLKFEESLHRIEKDEASSQVIQDSLENDYLTAGYRCIRVPVFSNDKEESISLRLEFIEKTLIDDQGLNFKGFNI